MDTPHETIIMMLENAAPLSVKAAGGVRTYNEAVAMIQLVKRIEPQLPK
jgi:deoxyribose-phosphate aldolase